MYNTEHLQEKWQPVLEHPDLPEIKDPYKRAVTTVILEKPGKGNGRGPCVLDRSWSCKPNRGVCKIGIRS